MRHPDPSMLPSPTPSRSSSDFAFPADPAKAADEQPIFWAPEALPSVVPLTRAHGEHASDCLRIDLDRLRDADVRQSRDGWYVILRLRGIEHRIWLPDRPHPGLHYAALLPLDQGFDIRAHAASRLWRALSGRAAGPEFRKLPRQSRQRIVSALRAFDARQDVATYRMIAEVLFGIERVAHRAWKTHDLRNRTIRLTRAGFKFTHGGYLDLLRYPLRRR